MMQIQWTSKALSDLARLHEFLVLKNAAAAAKAVQALVNAPEILLEQPRIGERIEEFMPRGVRRLLILNYEMRYEVQHETIYMLRIWHTREDR
jgi:plasmid stabilization system protein ParE